jgi:hypothetical protein
LWGTFRYSNHSHSIRKGKHSGDSVIPLIRTTTPTSRMQEGTGSTSA